VLKKSQVNYDQTVRVGIVAKYLNNEDTYYSVVESLKIAAWHEGVNIEITWVDAEKIATTIRGLKQYDGILIPGGFGTRGVEGKIAAAGFALQNNVPYLGLCLGLQVAVIAATRKAGVKDATSGELNGKSAHQAIYLMANQTGKQATGGTMRLGDYPAKLVKNSQVAKMYGHQDISERHRHRYEVNRAYENDFNRSGLVVSGESPDGRLV